MTHRPPTGQVFRNDETTLNLPSVGVYSREDNNKFSYMPPSTPCYLTKLKEKRRVDIIKTASEIGKRNNKLRQSCP